MHKSPNPQTLIVSVRLLWGPLPALAASFCSIAKYWTITMLVEVWMAVNLFRVFLVMNVRNLRWVMN